MGLRGPKPKTEEEWQQEVAAVAPSGVTCIDVYVNSTTPLRFRHTCGAEWRRSPADWRRSPNCPDCRKEEGHRRVQRPNRFSAEYFQERLNETHGNGTFTVLSDCTRNTEKARVRHNACGHEWDANPATMIRRISPSGCPGCNPARQRKSQEAFLEAIRSVAQDEYIPMSLYSGTNSYVTMRHVTCGHEWQVTPNNFLSQGTRCPLGGSVRISKLARSVYMQLRELDIGPIELEKRFEEGPVSLAGRPLFFDFWLPTLCALIEVDGQQHEHGWWAHRRNGNTTAIARGRENDRIKNDWVAANKIPLLRLRWDDRNYKDTLCQWIASLQA